MADPTNAECMERVIRRYIQACNDADAAAISACFSPEAVHYYPSPLHKISGATDIGCFFATRFRN